MWKNNFWQSAEEKAEDRRYDAACEYWYSATERIRKRLGIEPDYLRAIPTYTSYAAWVPIIDQLIDRIEKLEKK